MGKRHREWSPENGEVEKEEPEQETTAAAEPEQPEAPAADPDEKPDGPADGEQPEKPDAPEPGPLSKLQAAMRAILDYDQIGEIRLALFSREAELEKHAKKGNDLGVREEDARRRLHVIRGDSLRFGLTRIFAPEEVTEQRDVFFDRESPDGRPAAEEPEHDDTITFKTVDGRDVTAHRDHLDEEPTLSDLRAMHTAGTMPEYVKRAIDEADIAHLFTVFEVGAEQEGPEGAGAEAEEGRELAAASGISA